MLFYSRRYDESLAALKRASEIAPDKFELVEGWNSGIFELQGRYADAFTADLKDLGLGANPQGHRESPFRVRDRRLEGLSAGTHKLSSAPVHDRVPDEPNRVELCPPRQPHGGIPLVQTAISTINAAERSSTSPPIRASTPFAATNVSVPSCTASIFHADSRTSETPPTLPPVAFLSQFCYKSGVIRFSCGSILRQKHRMDEGTGIA